MRIPWQNAWILVGLGSDPNSFMHKFTQIVSLPFCLVPHQKISHKKNIGLRVFCVGNSCFLRRWLVLVFFATVPVGGVFCNGGGCFLRRSWWEGMFFATAGHVFCIGRVCFLRRWCFLRR